MMNVEIIGAMNAPKEKINYIDVEYTEVKTAPKRTRTARKILTTVKEIAEGIAFIAMFFTLIYGFSFLDLLTR